MTNITLPYFIPYFISISISIGVSLYAWLHRAQKGSFAYALLALSQAVWIFGYIFELASPGLDRKLFWDNFQWLGAAALPGITFIFAIQYTGRELPYRRILYSLMIAVPLLTTGLAYTNDLHSLIAIEPHLVTGEVFDVLDYAYGPASWVLFFYNYALLLPAIVILFRPMMFTNSVHRVQLGLVLTGVLIPMIGSVLAVMSITLYGQRDITPITFAVANVFVSWGLFRYQLLDIVPVARSKVVESMYESVVVIDMQNRIVDINPAGLAVRGRTYAETIGKSVDEVYAEWAPMVERFRDVFEARVKVDIPLGDDTRWFEMTISPLYDKRHEMNGRLLIVRDITAQEQAALWMRDYQARLEKIVEERTAELRTSNETLRQAQLTLDHASDAVIWVNTEGTITYANEAAANAAHISRGQMQGRKVWEVNRDVPEATWRKRWDSVKAKGSDTIEVSVTGEGGKTTYLEAVITYHVFDGQELYVSYGRDISERKHMEVALRDSEQATRELYFTASRQAQELTLLDKVRTALAREVDLKTLFRAVMTSIAETFGYTQVSLYLLEDDMLVLQDQTGYDEVIDRISVTKGVSGRVVRSGQPVLIEDVRGDPDFLEAGPGIVSEICLPLKHEGRVVGTLNVESTRGIKLTEADLQLTTALGEIIEVAIARARLYDDLRQELAQRQQAEVSLRDSEARFRALVENSQAGIYMVDDEFRFVYANQRLAELSGYRIDELIGQDFRDMIAETDRESLVNRYNQLSRGEAVPNQYEFNAVHKNGGPRRMEVVISRVQLPDGNYRSLGQLLDVTERWQAEQAVRRYADRLATLHEIDSAILIEETPEAIALAALARLKGLIPLVGSSVLLFDQEGGYAEMLATVSRSPRGTQAGVRMPIHTFDIAGLSDGKITIVPDALAVIPPEHPYHEVIMAEGIRSFINVPLRTPDRLIGSLNISADKPDGLGKEEIEMAGEVADQLAVAIQHASLRQQILRHTEELEERVAERTALLESANAHLKALARVKDEFVANVSHELRTPITNIKLYLDLLAMGSPKQDEYLATLRRENIRLESLIENLLLLSRLDQNRIELNLAPLDLNSVAEEYATDRARLAESKQLTLHVETGKKIPQVSGSRELLGQALSILLTNALNYTPPGGSVDIRTQTRRIDHQTWAGIRVEDTGPGIDPEDMQRLFTRFFRGKVGAGSGVAGTGLGLAIAREIVERHHGQIEAMNKKAPDTGAVFEVWLHAGS